LLFTSDLHGDREAFHRFARELARSPWDIGVIAGDLLDYDMRLQEIAATPGVDADELLEEIYGPEDTVEALAARIMAYRANPDTALAKAVRHQERDTRQILAAAGKPVVLVPGNHDLSDWESDGNIHNAAGRRITVGGIAFVGYRWTRLEISPEEDEARAAALAPLLDGPTVLLTHAPAHGVLDRTYRGIHIGSEAIARLAESPEVTLHLHGHAHHSFGWDGKSANSAWAGNGKFIGVDAESRNFWLVQADPA
jgi:Icc-related predicted phosphoesterase